MWSRSEVKKRAWNGLKGYYLESVLVAIVTSALQSLSLLILVIFYLISAICCALWVVSPFAVEIVNGLYSDILGIGQYRYILKKIRGEQDASVGTVFSGFSDSQYANKAKILLFRNIFQFLWGLLLIVPGIIKSYEYRMIPFILADHPDMGQDEVFKRSKQMMDGNKMASFVMDLSFIGWFLLGTLAMGIGTLFVLPYYNAAVAEQYRALSGEEQENGSGRQIAMQQAVLTGIEGEFTGAKIPIAVGDKLVIGRDPARCNVVINSPQVSGLHLTIEFDGNFFYASDVSTNGTYDLQQGRLPKGQRVRVTPGTYLQLGTGGDIFRLELS